MTANWTMSNESLCMLLLVVSPFRALGPKAMLNIDEASSALRRDKTQHLLKFALFCILATGLVVTFFYLTMDKTKNTSKGITCIGDFIGDGICDDSLNQKVCDYDNGDCCRPAIDKSNCFDCFCYTDNSYPPEAPNSKQSTHGQALKSVLSLALLSECVMKKLGDKTCDGLNNNIHCSFDDGDCCLQVIDGSQCLGEECRCHETNQIHLLAI